MADKTKTEKLEREYIIPLRNEWRKVANYRRTGRAVKEIKKFIAKHMKVPERDVNKVKLDIYLNNEIWFRGRKKPPSKLKVRAIKEGDFVKVELAELPDYVKFLKAKHEKKHKPTDKPVLKEKKQEKKEDDSKTEDSKTAEKEKEKSVAEYNANEAKQDAKDKKHTIKAKEPGYHRMALKK